jgi:hypothetical protein
VAKELRVRQRAHAAPREIEPYKVGQPLYWQLGRPEFAYVIWAVAVCSMGMVAGLLDADVGANPLQLWTLAVVLLGFGSSLAAINKSHGRSRGWIVDTLFGLFLSVVIAKYGVLLGMGLRSMQ